MSPGNIAPLNPASYLVTGFNNYYQTMVDAMVLISGF